VALYIFLILNPHILTFSDEKRIMLELTQEEFISSKNTKSIFLGGFAHIYYYNDLVIKIYYGHDEKDLITIAKREYHIMKILLNEENILQLVGKYTKNGEMVGIVLEYMENKDLWNYIDNNKSISLVLKLLWMKQITMGLQNIHKKGIVHCDLRCCNILLDKKLNAKICDFHGCYLKEEGYDPKHIVTGGFGTGAPETILEKKFSFASDIYSLGLLFLQMFMSIVNFCKEVDYFVKEHNNKTIKERQRKLKNTINRYIIIHPLKGLILKCTAEESGDRYSVWEIIKILDKMITYEYVKIKITK